MRVKFRKNFRKDRKKLTLRQEEAWIAIWSLFLFDPYHPKLRRHKLSGRYEGLESIDVLPDFRAVFLQQGDLLIFYYLRNHNQLYG